MGEYKIKDIETLTGIKSHTIRIWEKRYDILKPKRTSTKIRTYSDTDLTTILNVAILNKNGWKISRIAEISEEERQVKVLALLTGSEGDIHFEKMLLSLIELDEISFSEAIDYLVQKFGLEITFTKHLIQFLERIGVMWIAGTINPSQEHFIIHLIRQKLIYETAKLPIPKPKSPKVLLFLPENEWHELSLLFYHFILRNKRVNSFYLGQSLPYASVIECVERLQPKAIVTSILTAADESYYVNLFKKMRQDLGELPIYVGGQQVINYKDNLKKYITPVQSVKDLEALYFIK
jgi:MerR family transcriptional regulator, light-induced transcriptional regulator